MKKSTHFDTKIKAYSAMALCFTGAGVANAQIVYTDVNPDVVLTNNNDSIVIDFNNDATLDLAIRRFDWSGVATNTAVVLKPAIGNSIMATMGTTIPYVSALAAGAVIDGAATTWMVNDGVDIQRSKFGLASTYSGATYGHFGDATDHFIGCQFLIGGATYYGWVRVNVPLGGATGTVKDYAYQSTAGVAINAGDMVSGIDNAAQIESNIYSFNKNIFVNFNTALQGTIKIYNSLGEVVYSDNMDGVKKEINMSSQASGIYMIRIESATGNFTKKIKL
ncbi:MAG: T9SS type A sorting domain-containing protein [Bacteroidota bacterium]